MEQNSTHLVSKRAIALERLSIDGDGLVVDALELPSLIGPTDHGSVQRKTVGQRGKSTGPSIMNGLGHPFLAIVVEPV